MRGAGKTFWTWIALAASASFWSAASGLASVVGHYEITQSKERQQSIEPAKTPDGVEAQKIAWGAPGIGAGSFRRMPAEPLPLGWKIQTVCNLYLPADSGLRSFNLRVEDASGETFQFFRYVPGGRTGWVALTNVVDVANPPRNDSWGGNGDNIMDLPLTISGAGFEINKTPASGSYYFASVDYAPLEDSTEKTRIDLADGKMPVAMLLAEERKQTHAMSTLPDGRRALRIDWNGGEAKYDLIFCDGIPLGRLGVALFRAKVYLPEKGMLKAMNLRLQDDDGETLQYEQAIPQNARGWYDVVFPVNGTMSAPSSRGGSNANQRIDFPAKLCALAGVFTHPGDNGWMAIEAVEIDALPNPLDPRFETGSPIGVLRPGEEDKLGWRIANLKTDAVSATLQYQVEDVHGATVASNRVPVRIAPGAESFVQLPAPAKRGIYYASSEYREDGIGAPPTKKRRSFTYMTPAGPTPERSEGFIFGVCSHSQWKPADEQELQALAASWCGVKVLREDALWERMEPSPGAWNFRFFDSVVETFGRHGIEVAPIYCYRPDWAVARDWKPLKPESPRGKRPDYGHWANFVRTVADRYRDNIRYAEVWNEPDLLGYANFPAEEYIEMLKIAYAETKKAAPGISVLTGGFTMMPPLLNIVDPRHMEKTLVQGRGFYDVQAFHVHGTFAKYREQVDRLLKFREGLGVKAPWWANETAITSTGVGEYVQAKTLFQKFVYTWARGAIGYNWFSLCNAGNDPGNGEHNFGLLTKDFQPKAAYPVYNTIATYLTGAAYVRDLPLGSGIDAFLFKARNGDYLLANWNNDPDVPTRPAVLKRIAGAAIAVDMFGNETPLASDRGAVIFDVGLEPSLVRIANPVSEPIAVLPPVEFPSRLAVVPGETNAMRLVVRNPMDTAVTATIEILLPEGIAAPATRLRRSLEPGATLELAFPLDVASGFRSSGRNRREILVHSVLGDRWEGTFACKVDPAFLLPANGFATEPSFVLGEASQQTMLVPDAPDLAHLRWSGPADLSARVWLAHDGSNLLFKAAVVDDRHRQPRSGFDVFESDGVQVGIQPPGARGFWEIGLTRRDNGESDVCAWIAPEGSSTDDVARTVELTTSRDESTKTTTYTARLPLAAFGLQQATANGHDFGFNILVNDDDDGVREGFIEFVPGLGMTKDAGFFPRALFEPVSP